MDQKQIVKQILDLNKKVLDGVYAAVALGQEQNERLTKRLVEQSAWVPEEGKKVVGEWIEQASKMRNDFKKGLDEGLKTIEEQILVSSAQRTQA